MKVEQVLTLSVYEGGMHRVKGKVTGENKKWGMLSFAQSMSPVHFMIQEFKDVPLGTKIKVTMEVVK